MVSVARLVPAFVVPEASQVVLNIYIKLLDVDMIRISGSEIRRPWVRP